MDRRLFVVSAVGFGSALAARAASGQQPAQGFTPMQQDAYRPTLRPAKPGATPLLTEDQRDALEHRIKCQCSCILDVYTCRTTDFTCSVSPAMHRDVLRLIAGGYDADEILAAFVETYGEVALTEPVKQGFNWAGYFAPSVALATGGVLLTMLIRKWAAESGARAPGEDGAARAGATGMPAAGASSVERVTVPAGMTADDLARVERAVREDA